MYNKNQIQITDYKSDNIFCDGVLEYINKVSEKYKDPFCGYFGTLYESLIFRGEDSTKIKEINNTKRNDITQIMHLVRGALSKNKTGYDDIESYSLDLVTALFKYSSDSLKIRNVLLNGIYLQTEIELINEDAFFKDNIFSDETGNLILATMAFDLVKVKGKALSYYCDTEIIEDVDITEDDEVLENNKDDVIWNLYDGQDIWSFNDIRYKGFCLPISSLTRPHMVNLFAKYNEREIWHYPIHSDNEVLMTANYPYLGASDFYNFGARVKNPKNFTITNKSKIIWLKSYVLSKLYSRRTDKYKEPLGSLYTLLERHYNSGKLSRERYVFSQYIRTKYKYDVNYKDRNNLQYVWDLVK